MRFVWMIFVSLGLAGCASTAAYNPMQVAEYPAELLLNQSSLKAVHEGMTLDQVHQTMGQELVIGYSYQAPGYKPLTIPNPYKIEEVKDSGYKIEYYIDSIRQTDGIIHDNELTPLVFKDGKLVGRGWSLVNSIRPAKPVS